MKKKIILAIILVVIILGAGFAYAYFATDAFKTDKELFFKYVGSGIITIYEDEDLTAYSEKLLNTSSTYKGEAITKIKDLDADLTTEVKADVDGKLDRINNRTEMTMKFDYSTGVIIPINFKMQENTIGIQSDLLDSKYIAVKNENLKALAEKFGIDSTAIPDKLDFESLKLTDEEITALKEKYKNLFDENLTDDLFTHENVDGTKTIKLEMTAERFKEILAKLIQTLRDDEIILKRITDKDNYQKSMDALIEDLNSIESTDADKFVMNLKIKSRNVEKLEIIMIDDNETSMKIDIENSEEKLTIKAYEADELLAEITLNSTAKTENSIYDEILIKTYNEGETVELKIKYTISNYAALDNVTESLEFSISSNDSALEYKNDLTYKFDSTVEVEEFNEDNATILNDATDEELQMLMYRIYQNLGLI